MHTRRTTLTVLLVSVGVALTACSSGGAPTASTPGPSDDPNTYNTADVTDGGEVTVAISKSIENWNTLTAAGNVSETTWLLSAVYPTAFIIEPDGSTLEMNAALLEDVQVVSDDPTVVEYTIREEARWSDGVPITADDFIYQWQTLNGRDCPTCTAYNTDGLDRVTSIEPSNDGKTVTVTYDGPFSEWQRPFTRMLPAHIAAAHGSLEESFEEYFTRTVPEISGGPFIVTNVVDGQSVTLERNDEWYGEGPALERIRVVSITDADQIPIALQNGEIDIAYPVATVDIVQQLDEMAGAGVSYQTSESLVMENLFFNHSNSYLADVALRRAIATAIDTQEIIDKTVGQYDDSIEPLGNAMIMAQQDGYVDHAGDLGYGSGDEDSAVEILEGAGYEVTEGGLVAPDGTTVPSFRTVYTEGDSNRQTTVEVAAANLAAIGIELDIETTDALGNTFGEIAPYGYDLLLVGFTGSPFYASNAFGRYSTGTGDNQHYSSEVVDQSIETALAASSREEMIDAINEADLQMMEDVLLLPLYLRPSVLAYNAELANVRDNTTSGGKHYTVAEWGSRSAD